MIPPLALAPPFLLLGHLAYTDARTRRLPNRVVGLLALVALIFVAILPGLTWRTALLGCLLGAGVPLAMNALGATLGRGSGFGMGDVKLLSALGLLFGPSILMILGIACVSGSAFALLRGRRIGRGDPAVPQRASFVSEDCLRERTPSDSPLQQTFAFGPHIALAAALLVLATC